MSRVAVPGDRRRTRTSADEPEDQRVSRDVDSGINSSWRTNYTDLLEQTK
jgi:hypothetical protein